MKKLKFLLLLALFPLFLQGQSVNPYTGLIDLTGGLKTSYTSGGVAYFVLMNGDTISSDTLYDVSIVNRVANIEGDTAQWDTAYIDRLKWDGGSTGLTAATGRASLGAVTLGSNLFTIANYGGIGFIRTNADNTVTVRSVAEVKADLGFYTASDTTSTLATQYYVSQNGGGGSGDFSYSDTTDLLATQNYVDTEIAGLPGGHDAITLAGTPDYITLTDQVLTRNQIDLTADVTGVLPDANVANDITITNISQVQDITATATEINYTDGVTSNIQTQLDGKVDEADSLAIIHSDGVTASYSVTGDTLNVELEDGGIDGVHLNATNTPSDNQIPSYDDATGGFTWVDQSAGGSGGFDYLSFIVGATADAPGDGDSTLTHGSLFGDHIEWYKNGELMYYSSLSDSTLTVRPAYSTGDTIEIRAYSTVTTLTLRDIDEEGPTFSSAEIGMGNDTIIYVTLSDVTGVDTDSIPNVADFTFETDNETAIGLNATAWSGTTLLVGLDSTLTVFNDSTLQLTYSPSGYPRLQDTNGNESTGFTDQSVTNNLDYTPPLVYEAETDSLLARFTGTPTEERELLINRVIDSLKTSGLWAKSDALWFTNNFDQQSSTRNWITNDFHLTAQASIPHAVDTGFTGNASSYYLSTDYIISTDATNFTQNDAGMAMVISGLTHTTGTQYQMGTVQTGNIESKMGANYGIGAGYNRMNAAAGQINIVPWNGINGLFRYNSDSIGFHRNHEYAYNGSVTSVGVPSIEQTLLADNYAAGPGDFANGTIKFAWYGSSLTSDEWDKLTEIYQIWEIGIRDTNLFVDEISKQVIYLPTYDLPNNHSVHIGFTDADTTWNGYRYWLVTSGYTNTDYENPYVFKSNNGDDWLPAGDTGVSVVNYNGIRNNSDPFIFYEEDTLYVGWVYNQTSAIYLSKSTDGVTWADSVLIGGVPEWSTDKADVPHIVKVGSTYYMYYVSDIGDGYQLIERRSSNSIYGPYTSPDSIVFAEPTDRNYNHFSVVYDADSSMYYITANETSEVSHGAGQYIWMGYGTDGINFTKVDDPLIKVTSKDEGTPSADDFYHSVLGKVGDQWKIYYNVLQGTKTLKANVYNLPIE